MVAGIILRIKPCQCRVLYYVSDRRHGQLIRQFPNLLLPSLRHPSEARSNLTCYPFSTYTALQPHIFPSPQRAAPPYLAHVSSEPGLAPLPG